MSGLRFKAGELAVVAHPDPGSDPFWTGMVVTIEAVGPFQPWHELPDGLWADEASDYTIRAATGDYGFCLDHELRKIDPPDEEEDVTRRTELREELPA